MSKKEEILKYYLKLGGVRGAQSKTAKKFGVSRAYVGQIIKKAGKLKKKEEINYGPAIEEAIGRYIARLTRIESEYEEIIEKARLEGKDDLAIRALEGMRKAIGDGANLLIQISRRRNGDITEEQKKIMERETLMEVTRTLYNRMSDEAKKELQEIIEEEMA